jgi:phosphoribosylaminoimidazole-succinocarboxamide synthase
VTVLADLSLLASGKVREIYDLGESLLIVASDLDLRRGASHADP